ncbi:MAG: type II secretion system protein N [Pseudomonadota bacterium]
MRWWLYLLAGGISYLLFALAYLPAKHALYWLTPEDFPVVADDAQGTLWKGSATQTFYRDIELGSSAWAFRPLSLLIGQINYQIDLSDNKQKISGDAARNFITGEYVVSALKGSIEATNIPSLIGQPFVHLDGHLDIDIKRIKVLNQQVTAASGRLRWDDAIIQKPVRTKLGSLQFDLSGDETMLKTHIKDIAGPLKVDGVVELLPDGNYRINGKVKQTDSSDQGLVSLLQNIGRPLADGSTQIEYSGQL